MADIWELHSVKRQTPSCLCKAPSCFLWVGSRTELPRLFPHWAHVTASLGTPARELACRLRRPQEPVTTSCLQRSSLFGVLISFFHKTVGFSCLCLNLSSWEMISSPERLIGYRAPYTVRCVEDTCGPHVTEG